MTIPRLQAFEFCDQPWLPALIREGYMDCLDQIHRLFQPYCHVAPLVAEWARRLGVSEVLDLGSGGGGQVATILEHLSRQGLNGPRFVLSDRYPEIESWRALERRFGPERIGFVSEPVSFDAIPSRYRAVTIFSAFHHLPPPAARALLKEVAENRDGILIVEFTRRTWTDLAGMLPAFFLNLLAPLTTERFHWGKLALAPLVAAMVSFDGIVSVLRSYTEDEIRDLAVASLQFSGQEVPWGRLPVSVAGCFSFLRQAGWKR